MNPRPDEILEEIFALFAERGGALYGEAVSQEAHALQCAALAKAAAVPDALVAAALLHDIGHLLRAPDAGEEPQDDRHETVGAVRLDVWFGPRVSRPVALHVMAKRHLCAVEPGYAAGLSAASVASLAAQGGPLTPLQAERFARLPFSADAVKLRRFDDAAKETGVDAGALADHLELLERLLNAGPAERGF